MKKIGHLIAFVFVGSLFSAWSIIEVFYLALTHDDHASPIGGSLQHAFSNTYTRLLKSLKIN